MPIHECPEEWWVSVVQIAQRRADRAVQACQAVTDGRKIIIRTRGGSIRCCDDVDRTPGPGFKTNASEESIRERS